MVNVWIENSPDPNCKHEIAWICGEYADPPTSRGYYEIYCPQCDAKWDERKKNCKYTYLKINNDTTTKS